MTDGGVALLCTNCHKAALPVDARQFDRCGCGGYLFVWGVEDRKRVRLWWPGDRAKRHVLAALLRQSPEGDETEVVALTPDDLKAP